MKRSALHSESSGGAIGSSNHPLAFLEHPQKIINNFLDGLLGGAYDWANSVMKVSKLSLARDKGTASEQPIHGR